MFIIGKMVILLFEQKFASSTNIGSNGGNRALEPTLQDAYQLESEKLDKTLDEIDRQLEALHAVPVYRGQDYTEQVLESIRENKRQSLAIANGEPYFGRLDFHESGKKEPAPLYIGKVGVEKENSGELAVIDWRAPVASLFYSFTGGDAAVDYESPDGIIEGLVYLKRNIVIRKRILQRVVDTFDKHSDQLTVNDEFLLYRLGENKDNKLRDIVSTIQAEQDQIIRADKNTALIIQGVAGSGKTTVALHRIAYLLYKYREQVQAERMVIFAPNRMFLDYISGVLPELGVGHIQQTTFADWALSRLDNEVQLGDPAERLRRWFAAGPARPEVTSETPTKWKGSIAFLRWLDQCMDMFEAHSVPHDSYSPWEGNILSGDNIVNWYEVENKHYPPAKRRERVLSRIKRWQEMQLSEIADPKRRKEWKSKASARLRDYTKKWKEPTAFALYKQLLGTDERPAWLTEELLSELPSSIREAPPASFRKKRVEPEDLAPLVYIHMRLYGIESGASFDHTVIDEAQDFSPFQVSLLRLFTKSDSFTILGDLSQGIHSYQGIDRWADFSELFPEEQRGYFQLERSYRSTTEIIYFANEVLKRSPVETPLAIPVFRGGEPVMIASVKPDAVSRTIGEEIRRLQAAQHVSTIAVIGRTESECKAIHTALTRSGLEPHLIEASMKSYAGGLSVVPVYLAKGLEFDAVLISGVDAEQYKQTSDDAKLLYVACTRALHELQLFYSGQPSPLIDGVAGDFVQTRQKA
jgi:DNA helicase-2/ATP-dependent DNA helicase PcrA